MLRQQHHGACLRFSLAEQGTVETAGSSSAAIMFITMGARIAGLLILSHDAPQYGNFDKSHIDTYIVILFRAISANRFKYSSAQKVTSFRVYHTRKEERKQQDDLFGRKEEMKE